MTTIKYKDAGVWKYLPLGGPSSVPIDAWTTIAGLGNNWTGYPGYPPQYRKRPDGIVELRGLIRNGNNGQDCWAVGALPADCCPDATVELYFTTMAQGPSSTFFHHDCYIRPNGTLRSLYTGWGAQQSGYFALDGIRYSTAQTAFPTGPQGPQGPTGGNATVAMDALHAVGFAGEPAFTNNWVADSGTWFRKYPDGKVRLFGRIKGGTIGAAAFTLPVGYRPFALTVFDAVAFSTVDHQAEVRVDTTGTVICTVGSPSNWLALDGIEFDTNTVTNVTTGPQGPVGPTMVGSAFHLIVNAAQNLGGGNPITWSGEIVDTDNLRSANITAITLPAGVWFLSAGVRPDTALAVANAYMQVFIQKNGANVAGCTMTQVAGSTPPTATIPCVPVVSDGTAVVRVIAYTNNTGSIFASSINGIETMFAGVRVGS